MMLEWTAVGGSFCWATGQVQAADQSVAGCIWRTRGDRERKGETLIPKFGGCLGWGWIRGVIHRSERERKLAVV